MIIDVHVHLLGMSEANGCYISPKMSSGIVFFLLARVLGMKDISRDNIDEVYRAKLSKWAEESDLDGVGVLAFDGVYDEDGELDRKRTHMLIGNDYCLEVCSKSSKLLPICSVSPQRKDAIEELERVVAAGAVAIKLLPNTHGIDPLNDAYRPFWRRMKELGIPLISHTSFEHTLPVVKQLYGKPERLRGPLEEGVTVIAAHCAGSGVAHPFNEDIHTWFKMLAEYPNLYGDISAMASMARFPYIHKVLRHKLARERILLGSDLPVPASPLIFTRQLGFKRAMSLHRIENPLQKNLEVFKALGVDDTMLRRAAQVLKL